MLDDYLRQAQDEERKKKEIDSMQIGLQGAGERQARIKDEQASQMRLSEQSQQELQKRGITRAYGQGTYELNKQYESEPSAVDNYRERAEEAYQSDVNYTANATFKEFLRDKDTQDYLQSPEIQAIIQRANEAQDPAEKEQLASEVYNQLYNRYWDSDHYKKVEEFTNRERENIDRRILKDQLSSFKDDLTKSVESAPESELSEKSGRNIRTAKHLIDDSNKLIKNAETGAGIGKGVGDAVFDADTWTFGVTDLVRQNRVGNVADKYERGEKLTKDEEALMDALALHMAASAYYQSGISRQYKWGQVAGESLPFMIEFILNPIAGVGKGIAKSIAKRAITKFGATGAAKTAIKAGSRAVGDVIGATAMSATTGAPAMIADAKRRILGDATFAIGEDGDFAYAGHEGGVDPITAASKAFVAQTLEYQSEMLGASGLGKLIGKAVPKGMTKAFKASEFGKMGAGMRNSNMYREARALMERGQWSGTFGEYGEEVYNQAMNALIVGDNKLSDLTDVHEQIDIFMGLALTGGVMGTVSSAAYLRDRNRVNARIKNADRQAAAAIEGWDEIKEQIGNMSVSERTRAAAEAMFDDSVPVGTRKAYADYIINLSQRDSMLGAMQEKQVRDIEIGKETGTRLYSSLRDKRSVALYSLNNEKQQLEAELGDLTTLTFEEVANSTEATPQLVEARRRYDIVNAEYEGVIETLKREVDDFIAPQVKAIQDVAANGVITELNIGTEDNPDIVYLTGGKIAINEDGTIDPSGTAPLLTVKNSERKGRYISRKRIVTAQQDDLDATIEGIKQRAYEKFVRPLADKLEGKTHFQNGEQVEYVNAKGETVAGTVTAKQNNTVTVVGIDGKKTETFTEDELAQRLVGETIDDVRTRDVIQVELNGQVYDANVTNIQDGIAELHIPSFPDAAGRFQDVTAAELRRMRVMPQMAGPEQAGKGDKTTQETQQNAGIGEVETQQNVSETQEPLSEGQNEPGPVIHELSPEQQQDQFIASLPKTKDGEVDYEQIQDDDTFIAALQNEFADDASEIVEEYKKQAEKKLKDAGRIQDPVKRKRAQRQAQQSVDRFNSMYEKLNPRTQYEARVNDLEAGNNREREAKMGEYLSLRDYLLRNIATGKYKFRWNENDTDKGLGGELFGTKNQEVERKKRIPFLNNNGHSPESLAELIAESAGQGSEINPGWFTDASQIRDEIIDILLSHDTPTSMIDAATELRKQPETYEEYVENFVDPAVIFEYEANEASQDEMLRSLPTEELHNQISDQEVELYFTGNNSTFDITNTQQYDNQNEGTRAGSDRADAKQFGARTDQGDNSRNDGGREDQAIGDIPFAGEAGGSGERSTPASTKQPAAERAAKEPVRPAERQAEGVAEQEGNKINAEETEKINKIFASVSHLVPVNGQLWANTSISRLQANNILKDIREFQEAAVENGTVEYKEHLDRHYYEMVDGKEIKINTYKLNGYTIEIGYEGHFSSHGSGLYTKVENPQGEVVKIYDPKYRTDRTIDISYRHPRFIKKQSGAAGSIEAEAAKVDVNPTEAQKEAGNYKKGHVTVSGFDITIEIPKGSERSGTDPSGRKWTRTLKSHYGYFKRTQGKDGDQIDVFVGENPESRFIFVVDQLNQDGTFDEHKVMLGYDSFDRAKEAYLENYEDDWTGLGAITVVEMEDFRKWLDSDNRRIKPFAEYKQIQEAIHETKKEAQSYPEQTTIEKNIKHELSSTNNEQPVNQTNEKQVDSPLSDQKENAEQQQVDKNENQPAYGANNKIITQDRYNELREQMRKKLNNLNVGFDPEVFSIGAQMAMYHIESGAHRFADFAKRMVDDLGDAIRPYLKASYEGARAMPGMEELSKTMDPYKDVVAFDVNQSFEEAQAPKEPWQMTREEYLLTNGLKLVKNLTAEELKEVSKNDNTTIETLKTLPEFAVDISTMKIVGDGYNDNYEDVKKALTEGKYVPAEVLAGYPELEKKQDEVSDTGNDDLSQKNPFSFKQESPMAYGRAMKILEKRYRYPDGKVMTRYEWIESLPHGLEVRTVKVAAKNDEGFREELWLNQTTITKTEQDYYEYLQQGGKTITDHLAEEEKKAIEEEKRLIEERKVKEEEKRKQDDILQAKQDQNRKDTMAIALQSSRDEFIEIGTKNERDYVESFNNRRRKDSAYERDLAVANNNLEARKISAGKFYDMAKSIYTLDEAGNPVRKYNYKVGDKVVVTAWANPVETVIQEVKGEGENAMYVVEKRDGIHNQHVHYDSMRPVEKDTITKEQYESFDTRGYTYAVVKDGKVVTRGSNPILAKEPMPIKSLLDIADNLNGDLYIAPTSGQPIDTSSTDDLIIGGLTWQQILDKQQGKSINLANELKMPENAVLFPKYEQLYQNDLVENDVPVDSQPIDIVQKAKDSVENDRKNKPQAQGKSTSTPVEKIEDFGEKIGGARKDLAQEYKTKLSEIKEDDIRSKPLSKIFPRLDLKKLVENGDLTQDDALYLNYRYDKIPTKPRVTGGFSQKRKLDKWINDVQKEIKIAHTILSQEKSFGHLDLLKRIKLEENAGYRYFQNGDEIEVTPEQRLMLNDDWMHIKALKALGFPTSGVKMGNARLQYRVHSGEQYIVKVNNKRSLHKTFEDAVDYLRNELEKPTNRETVFNIYQNRKSGKYFIGKPIQGKEPIQLSEWFDTQKEVTDYFRDNRDEVQAKWDAMSVKPEERRSENRERQGRDWRNGKDVTPEQFQSEFGFRGTEFGNWVNQQERQDALNNAYDALMDLSSVLDISPRALSLNGELGMAFGARGTGNAGGSTAAAHYESAKVVINLTKKSGSGSLAHEWWHALDNYFARMGKKSLDFATDGTKGLDANVREEMKQAFNDIVNAIKKSELPKRSGELDKTRSKPYWATNVEMSARAFENYVIEALSKKGDSNDYLANFKELSDWATVGSFEVDSYPYPTKEESHDINEKFQQFFDTIQEKLDEETGNTLLFRKVDESGFYSTVEDSLRELAPNGMPLFRKKDSESREAYAMREWNRAKNAINKLSEKMGLDVEIMETTEGLPKGKAESKGWYDVNSKKITIVMPNHTSSWDAQATLLHEAVGHHGLRELFGEHFDTFLDNVYNNAEEGIKDQIDRIGGDTRRATDEYLSRLAEDQEILQTDRLRGFFNEVRKFFFEMLAKLGFKPGFKLSENELKYILWRSYQNLSEPGRYRSIAGHAKDVAMQHSLKVGNYAEKEVSANVAEEPGAPPTRKLNKELFGRLSDAFNNAKTLDDKYDAAFEIIQGIEAVIGGNQAILAKTHEELANIVPGLSTEERQDIMDGLIDGMHTMGEVFLDIEAIDSAGNLISTWFHENAHRITRNVFSDNELEQFIDSINPDYKHLDMLLPESYRDGEKDMQGSEFIARAVEYVSTENSLEDVANNNIDYGTMPDKLRNFVEQVFNNLHDEQSQKSRINTGKTRNRGLSSRISNDNRGTGQGNSKEDSGIFENFRTGAYLKQRALENNDGSTEGIEERVNDLFENADNLKKSIPNYPGFLNDVLQGSPAKSDIIANAREKGFTSMPKAIEEYLANVEDPAELSRIKELLGVDMPDNALRYMLWRNANPDDGTVIWKAKEAVKTNELDENILFRKGEVPSSIKNDKYEQRIRSRHNRGFRSLMYGIEEGWFDRMASLRIIQDAITGGKAVPDKANAYMLENQLSSRNTADIRYYTKNLVDPFLEQIHKIFGIDRNAADEYMNAKHGLERNDNMAEEEAKRKYAKKIASLNKEYADEKIDEDTYNEKMEAINGKIEAYAEKLKEEKDYSGLTAIAAKRGREDFKAVAQEIVAEVEGGVPKEDIDALWSHVNKATKWILDKQYNAGIMTKETYEKIRSMYKYYVPLRGFEEVTATDLYEYIDNSPSNFEGTLKTAHGRTSRAESPIVTIMSMGESGIMQANRNRMKQAFYRLVATNPSNYASIEDVWFVETADGFEERFPKIDPTASADEVLEAIADFNNDMAELAAEGKAFQGRNKLDVGVKIMKAQASEHVIRVWIAGEEKVIFINGNPRAAQAINGLVQKDLLNKDNLRHAVHYWSRQMAANFTSRNPAFMVTNLMRDVQFAVISAAVKEGIPYSMQLAKNITLVGKTISANVFKDGNKDNAEFQKYWEEFEANGGETGYANLHSIDYNKKYVKKKLREFSDQRDFLKPFRTYVEFMEKGNRTIEDMSRFATYVTSRQMGRSIERSVSDAKEITINFNKMGSGGFGANLVHSFYLFSNPALQSMRLLGMLAKNHPVRFTAMLSTTMAAGFMVPMINELLLGLFGDDDDKEKYANITPWVRRNNLVLYAPGTKGKFITLMLPHELRAFYGIGEMAYEKANGGLRHENMVLETAKQMTAMLPIDPMGGPDWWVPDALKPPYQAYETNRNFMDRPIYRKSIWNEHDPEWTKAYKGTPELLVEAAKGASDMTGGDEVVPGWLNPNPARAYHMFSGYLGGFMTTYTDLSMIGFNLLTGRDVRQNDIPVVNKLIRTSDEKTEELRINSEYFYYIDWIREYEHRTKGYEKRVQDPEYRDKYMDVMRDKEQRMYNFAKGQIALIDQLKDYDEEKANEMKEQFVRKMWEYEDQD